MLDLADRQLYAFVPTSKVSTYFSCNDFSPYKKYLDGAVMSNNPTLDLLTEITEYNASMEVSLNF